MNIWKSCKHLEYYKFQNNLRSGLRLRFDKGVDKEVRRACIEFCKWLRENYVFPIRVVIYFKPSEIVLSTTGEEFSALFWGPFDRKMEPYILMATGDLADIELKRGKDNALAAVLCSIAHELTHYFQWVNDIELSDAGKERQANILAKKIIRDYAGTRERP